ncbi:MAG: SMI1/KNR4 family protein [Myxococcales bacterium]
MASSEIVTAVEQIKQWMLQHGAPLLVENLAPGASPEVLAQAEQRFGFPLPEELKALWSLHHGQREELNGFIEFRDLLDTTLSFGEVSTVAPSVESLRESPEDWAKAGITAQELECERWVPFAGRDSDLLVVHAVSGRVFACEKDWPPLRLLAGSLSEWWGQFASRVVADDYAVEEDFGDYHLALRDRRAEQRDEEQERAREEAERYRRETPLLDQLREGLGRKDADCCQQVFEDTASRAPAQLGEAVQVLFTFTTDPKLLATSLQVVLRSVTLTAAQWKLVADGGKALGNEAIAAIANEHAEPAPPTKPWWKRW